MTHPITAVVPSLDGPVLEVLVRTSQPLSGRQVHRLAETGSEAGVRKVLTRLVEQGLVQVNEVGHTLLYSLNREHLAISAIETLARLRALLFERLRSELSTWKPSPVQASVFGSTARGDGDAHSDVDILLIRAKGIEQDDPAWQDHVSALADRVRAWTGNHAQFYDLDEAELKTHVRAGEAIVTEWKRDAITLHGPQLGELLRDKSTQRGSRKRKSR